MVIVAHCTCHRHFSWLSSRRRWFRRPYPPGPPADPIIGHLRVMPQNNQEVIFREMSKIYGDVLYFRMPGRSYLILNSLKSATELLDKRSGIYSDRPKLPLYEIMGWVGATLSLMPYGKRFQQHRKLLNEYLHEKKCIEYWHLQTKCARQLLVRLLDTPDDWMKHFDRFATHLIVKITYGRDIVDNDPYLDICEKALTSLISCGSMGGTPVDFLPFLRHLPSWFPGTYYAYKARSFRPAVLKMYRYPFVATQRELNEGTAQPSYVAHHLTKIHGKESDDEVMNDIQGSAGQLLAAGAETTASALSYFVFAMVLFPDVQKKAQEEVDRVIGKSRIPDISDRSSLPYVRAVMYEVLRWNTVFPLGLPHGTTDEDIYNGMYIPKGTTVIYNAYAILRDETVYSNPDTFNPSRYLPKAEGNGEPYPAGHFGFGRRICSGQHLVEASLFIAIVSILATLDISRAKDENGNDVIPEEIVTGLTSHPKPFPCVIKPRDTTAEGLIRQAQLWDEN